MKRDVIKKLISMGVRYAEKPGVGKVKLNHLKHSQLLALLAKLEAAEIVE